MNILRFEAAKRLEEFGWALVRYARRVMRSCDRPDTEHTVVEWHTRARARLAAFKAVQELWREEKRQHEGRVDAARGAGEISGEGKD